MYRFALFLLGIYFLPLGVIAQAPAQLNPYGEFLTLEDNKEEIIKVIKILQEDLESNKKLIDRDLQRKKTTSIPSYEAAISRAQRQIDAGIKSIITINAREKELIGIITTDSFIITAPDNATARLIYEIVDSEQKKINSSFLPRKNPIKGEDPIIKIMIAPEKNTADSLVAGFREVLTTDFNDAGQPFQHTLCYVQVAMNNSQITSLDSCKGSISHELAHASLENEVRQRLSNTKDLLEIPAALHEGLATQMNNDGNVQKTLKRTLSWYYNRNTGEVRKISPARQLLSIKKIKSSDYSEYAESYALGKFLFSLDTTKDRSKYVDFTVAYLQTKDWDAAAKIYGFKDLNALNTAFQKWFVKYAKSLPDPTLNLR